MAVVDVQFRANASFQDLIAQVNAANAAVKNLNASFATMGRSGGIDGLVSEFTQGLAASRQFTTETVRLRSEAAKFGEDLDKQRLKLRDYHREYMNYMQGRKSMITELARQQTMLERSMVVTRGRDARGNAIADVITPTGLDSSMATKAAVARKELQIMNKVLNDGATSLINWGKNTQWAGRQLTVGLTVPLTILGGTAAKLAYDLDQQMTRIVKVYGNTLNAVMGPAQIRELRSGLMGLSNDLARVYGQSAQETLGLAAEFAAAGKQGEELMQSVTQTTRLATLGEVDRAEAMKATLAIQTAFKQNTEELTDSINFLNAVENQTNTTLNDLVEAIPKAGPIVKGLGGDIKELSLLVVAMREGGIPAAEAANALKSGLASLINPTKQAKEMLGSFGIDMDAVTEKAGGKLLPMILGFQAELDKLDEFSKQQVIEQIFGKYQFARMGALFANLNREGSQTVEVLKLMGASTAELATIADRELGALQNSISGQFNRALEQVKVELAGIGEGFLELATKGLNAINWLFERFDSLPDIVKTGIGGIATAVAVIGPLIMTTGVLGNLLGYVVKGIAWFKAFGKSGVSAFSLLTTESQAAKLAGDVLETSFYDQAKAAAALDAGINKLIASLNKLAQAQTGAGATGDAVVATSAATTAEKTKDAVVATGGMGGTRGYLIENPNSAANRKRRSGTDSKGNPRIAIDYSFEGQEFNHLLPASDMRSWGYGTLHGVDPNNLGVAGTMLNPTSVGADFQKKVQASMYAESIVSLSDSDADLMQRRTEMLEGIAGSNAEAADMIRNMSDQDKALLLPTKESFERVQIQEAAFWKTIGENNDAAITARRTVKDTIAAGGTYQEAWTAAYLDVNKQHGRLLEDNAKHLKSEFRKIVNGNQTLRQKLEAAIRLVALTQAEAVSSLSGTIPGLNTGTTKAQTDWKRNKEGAISVAGGRTSALYLSTALQDINVRQQIVAEMKDELAIMKSRRRAQQKVVAQQERLVAQLTREVAEQERGSSEEKAAQTRLTAATNKLAAERSKLAAIETVIPNTRGSGTTAVAAIGQLADAADKTDKAADKTMEASKNMVIGGRDVRLGGAFLAADDAVRAGILDQVGPAGGSSPIGGGRRGGFRSLMGNRWVKGAGAAAGVGLMSAGMSGDGMLGAAGTIAGGAMTGGMLGSMFAPGIGTAIGAGVGALASGIPLLVQNIQRANDELASAGKVGETAFEKLGAALKSANDVALVPFVQNAGLAVSEVNELAEAIRNAAEGTDDANFRELLKGEDDKGNLLGLLKDKITAMKIAGVEAQKINNYIVAALNASGKITDAAAFMPELMQYANKSLPSVIEDQLAKYQAAKVGQKNMGTDQIVAGEIGRTPANMGGAVSESALADAQNAFKLLQDLAATAPPVALQNTLAEMAVSLPAIEDVMAVVPENFKEMANAIQEGGGTSTDILSAISLSVQGVALDLDKVSSEPWYIDMVVRQTIGSQAYSESLSELGTKAFADRMVEVNALKDSGANSAKARNDAKIKAQEDYIDELRDKYDEEIEAERKKQEALDEAQEAEKRRLDRQKTMRDLQVSYNEALASGNFGQAALVKNEMSYTRSAWDQEDKERIADKAANDRIEAIENERDAVIKAEEAKLEAMRANQAAMTDTVVTGVNARYTAEKEKVDAAQAEYTRILNDNKGNIEAIKTELLAKSGQFKEAGINVGSLIQAAIAENSSEGTAEKVFKAVGGNLAAAPWGLLGDIAAAKIKGDTAEQNKKEKELQDWVETKMNAPRNVTVTKDSSGRIPATQLATGGYVAGQGHGTSDEIDAKLSNGEFVMTNASVNYYGKGFMDAINKRKFAAGGLVEGLSNSLLLKTLLASTDIAAGILGGGLGGGTVPITTDAGAPGASGGGGSVVGTGLGAQIAALGARYVGVPYSYTGGSPEDGWGCAPFVRWVYQQFGVNLPGGSVSNSQYNAIKSRPARNEITAGDLLFFKYANGVNLQNPINHVGLYMGGGSMVHAANKQKGTIISPVDWGNYVAAARPIDYATGIKNFARGGMVGMIKPGEFMVQQSAVEHYGEGFLNAINNQTYHQGGLVTANGPKRGVASGGGNQYNFNINGYNKDPKELAREVVKIIEHTDNRKRSRR